MPSRQVGKSSLPRLPSTSTSGLSALWAALHSKTLLVGLFAVLLTAAGHFTGFTYIRPALESLTDIDADGLAALLLVYGFGNVLGTVLSGILADRALRFAALLFPVSLGAGILIMAMTGDTTAGMYITAAMWGFGFGGVPAISQTWGARAEPGRLEQVGGLIVTVFQIDIAAGAIVGGVLVDSVAASGPLVVGGVTTIVGGVLLAGLIRRG